MRAISLVLLSIAIMALLFTDADAKRRSSAQGSQAVGPSWCATYPGQGINENCGYSSFDQCWATVLGRGGFCRPNPFPGRRMGPATTGRHVPRAKRGAGIRNQAAGQELIVEWLTP